MAKTEEEGDGGGRQGEGGGAVERNVWVSGKGRRKGGGMAE